MVSARQFGFGKAMLTSAAVAALLGGAGPAAAQDGSADARVRRLEAEVRALQRKVFPGGGGQGFEPEITAPAATAPTGVPTTTPTTDLLNRMEAVEAQLARITAQQEQNTNRLAQIEARLPPAAPVGPPADPAIDGATPTATPPPSPPAAGPAATAPSDSRVEAVRAIEKPRTADAGDDEYSYGFRLFDAKFYPEAEQQLRLYLQKYPKHARVSYARNLLGRAYLADGDPREAAKWFLQNYQADKAGARAPDSLLNLARSMKSLRDTKRACIALGEFQSSYAAEAAGRLRSDYDDTRQGLTCS